MTTGDGRALPAPHAALRACVVVPARNEEVLIPACLQALASQRGVRHDEYEVLLVLDACTDGTRDRAEAVRKTNPTLILHTLDGPGLGSGPARRVGMEAASTRLHALGRPEALICCTDADTVVAPDWLSEQLAAAARGARAIGGRISLLDDGATPRELLLWHENRGRERYSKLLSTGGDAATTQHWQFSGASLSLTAATYRMIGGLRPVPDLEDEDLERVLTGNGVAIHRLASVRVATSPRIQGRASRGLAHDLYRAARNLRGDR